MKLLLTTTLPDIHSEIDTRFGRGSCFLIVDSGTLEWKAFPNPAKASGGGAGLQAAQFAFDQKCDAVISGDFGPNAAEALTKAGIAMYLYGDCCSAFQAIQLLKSGQLAPAVDLAS